MKAPVFPTDGTVEEPLRVTAFHNGILIHDDAWVYGEVGGPYKKHGKRPKRQSFTAHSSLIKILQNFKNVGKSAGGMCIIIKNAKSKGTI